jgi:Spy/CpxP family protein refolding chaperone
MVVRKSLTFAALAFGLMLAFGAYAFGQQTQQQPGNGGAQQREGREGRGRREGRGGAGFGMRGLRELNLSDAQREQAHAIFERFGASIRPQREQLMELRKQSRDGNAPADAEERAKTLRAQIRESEKAMRTELMGILTPEQRTRLEEIEKEQKARRDQMRQRREGSQPEIQ